MKKIDSFTGKYSLSKTLRFRLIPVGKTLENFKNKKLLDEDMTRAENYEKIKTFPRTPREFRICILCTSVHYLMSTIFPMLYTS